MLNKPNLAQLLYIAERMTADEVRERACLGFGDFDYEATALMCRSHRGPSHVFVDAAGLPYYVAGFSIINSGVAMAWSMSTDKCGKHVMEMTRISRAVIRSLMKDSGIHRVQMMCMATRSTARRWFEALGASHEATFKGYGRNGEDFVMYAITREAP